ncbi:hypothetical protein [Thermomonospora umbrina]|uniref:Uncharacterized protein n=1 Tax=Thermomonospora umbrina TaxID=111806 RepID=A0A3D9SYI5_9ACTN|nr:hypothetical protein [Thermomonospora umbrina]REF00638.1 hypothetical protein DFJ69_6194 [Thermomonospora umbrina]
MTYAIGQTVARTDWLPGHEVSGLSQHGVVTAASPLDNRYVVRFIGGPERVYPGEALDVGNHFGRQWMGGDPIRAEIAIIQKAAETEVFRTRGWSLTTSQDAGDLTAEFARWAGLHPRTLEQRLAPGIDAEVVRMEHRLTFAFPARLGEVVIATPAEAHQRVVDALASLATLKDSKREMPKGSTGQVLGTIGPLLQRWYGDLNTTDMAHRLLPLLGMHPTTAAEHMPALKKALTPHSGTSSTVHTIGLAAQEFPRGATTPVAPAAGATTTKRPTEPNSSRTSGRTP